MTLREEIYEYLGNDKITTDEIISKIVKRIDEFITEDRKRPYAEQDEVIAAIEDLKKEILK
jgi:hypothetical protein